MITKTIRGDTILAALEKVQQELGPEALIVSVREVPGGSAWNVFAKPQIEVVGVRMEKGEQPHQKVAVEETEIKNAKPWSPGKYKPTLPKPYRNAIPEPLAGEKLADELRRKIQVSIQKGGFDDALDVADDKYPEPPKGSGLKKKEESSKLLSVEQSISMPPFVKKIVDQLARQGVADELVKRLSQVCQDTLSPSTLKDEKRVNEFIRKQLEACLRVHPNPLGTLPKIICLVGASGSGKTSTCAKLAVHFSRLSNHKVSWVCADTFRTGAIAEAHTYADTIGIPLNVAYTPDDLSKIVADQVESDVILVDTPASNPRSEANLVELGAFLTMIPKRLTWMVAAATTREHDLQNAVAAFNPLRPRGLILTKLDETNVFGSIFNIAWRTQIPLVYFTSGSRVVNDLIPAKVTQFVQAIFDERFTV